MEPVPDGLRPRPGALPEAAVASLAGGSDASLAAVSSPPWLPSGASSSASSLRSSAGPGLAAGTALTRLS